MKTWDKVEGLQNKYRKKVFYCIYKLSPEKTQNSFSWHWIKEKFLPVWSLVDEVLHALSVLVLQKRYFPKYRFFSLKMSAWATKSWHSMFVKIFQVSADEGNQSVRTIFTVFTKSPLQCSQKDKMHSSYWPPRDYCIVQHPVFF